METLKALILGIIQGIFEWLPLSSEGVTSLVMLTFFGDTFKEAVFLALWIHSGTVLAAIIFFRKDLYGILENIVDYVKGSKQSRNINKLTVFLILSTFFTALIGTPIMLLGIEKIEVPGYLATSVVGVMLIITGFIQLITGKGSTSSKKIKIVDAIPVGVIQGFTVFPGISRSGITVSTLLFLGYGAKNALRISFLMSIPVGLGAAIGIAFLHKITLDISSLVAVVSSFFVGLFTIKLFLTVAEKINFGYFCILIGIISFFALFL